MPKLSRYLLLTVIILLLTADCFAGQVRVYVSPFAITGAANKDEIKTTLQNLLLSRLSNDAVIAVENAEQSDINISGSYIAFGKIYSIDAVAKSREGKILVRAFEQGESQDEILLSISKLSKAILAGIDKNYIQSLKVKSNETAVVRAEQPSQAKDIVRPERVDKTTGFGWISQKIEGELVGIALGRKMSDGDREIFIAGNNSLHYYRLGRELTLVAEVAVPIYQKILGLDTADLDNDGVSEVYLTLMNRDDLSSEVWIPEGNGLKKISEKLPYYFRAISAQGKGRKLYAQQTGRDADYYGELYEVTKKGISFDIKNPLELPKGANIYNTGMIQGKEGKSYFVVLNQDGYIIIYDENRKDLWKSSDKYGGTENFFSREDLQGLKVTGTSQRKIFLEQRITVTKNGEIIVPKNDGFFSIGNNRSYSKNFISSFAWNGVMLDELWHTKQSQNYLSDYIYDDESKELLLLEVVKKSGIFDKGASAISIKKVE